MIGRGTLTGVSCALLKCLASIHSHDKAKPGKDIYGDSPITVAELISDLQSLSGLAEWGFPPMGRSSRPLIVGVSNLGGAHHATGAQLRQARVVVCCGHEGPLLVRQAEAHNAPARDHQVGADLDVQLQVRGGEGEVDAVLHAAPLPFWPL